jgi:hypothetical protein
MSEAVNPVLAYQNYTCTVHELLILPMIIIDTVDFVVNIHCEGNTIQTFIAHAATETTWMIGLPHRLQDLLIIQII